MPIVKSTLDPNNPPKVSQEALKRIDAIKDEDIDYSDIPELTDALFSNKKVPKSPDKDHGHER